MAELGGALAGPPRLVLGFDFGRKRIGTAVGQNVTGQATALANLPNHRGAIDWRAIEGLLREWQPDALIVGLPLGLDGGEQPLSLAARRFARRLHGRFRLPVHLIDERFTTRAAEALLRESTPLRRSQRLPRLDAVAAKLLVETWLSEQPAGMAR